MKKNMVLATLALAVALAVFVASSARAEEREGLIKQAEALRQDLIISADKLKSRLFEAALINAEMLESGKVRRKFFQNQNERLCRLYDMTNWQVGEVEWQNFPLLSGRDLKLWIIKLQVDIDGLKKAAAAVSKGRVFREEAFFSIAGR